MKKILSMTLIILIVAAGTIFLLRFILGGDEDTWICKKGEWIRHGKPTVEKPISICMINNEVKDERATPKEVAEIFYDWYLSSETDPFTSGAYKTSGYLTDGFREKLDELLASFDKESENPLFCSPQKPNKLTMEQKTVEGDSVVVVASGLFDDQPDQFDIVLKLTLGEWKIDDIKCKGKTE